jgi:hypothetical protein
MGKRKWPALPAAETSGALRARLRRLVLATLDPARQATTVSFLDGVTLLVRDRCAGSAGRTRTLTSQRGRRRDAAGRAVNLITV